MHVLMALLEKKRLFLMKEQRMREHCYSLPIFLCPQVPFLRNSEASYEKVCMYFKATIVMGIEMEHMQTEI